MKVVRNYLYNAFYQVFILIVPLVTTPYLARVLGPKGVGINAYTNSVIQYFILFGSIGVNLYGNRQVAFVRDDRKKLTKTFFEIFFMRVITVLMSYFVFCIFVLNIHKYTSFYFAQSISIIASAFDISWFFMGVENFAVTVIRNLLIKIITLISIFSFVKNYSDLTIYIIILSLSLLLGNLTLFPSLKKYIVKIKISDLDIWKHLKPSLILFVPQIATQIYLVLNKTMLGSLVSVQSAGYFDQSDKVIKMVLAVVTATGTVMLPHVANAFSKGNISKTKDYLYKSFEFVTAISFPLMFGLVAVTSKFVPLFFTNKFIKVINIMKIESLVIVLIAWGSVIGTQFLLPTNRTKDYTKSVILGACINLIANIPLIMLYGASGAAIATVVSELTVTTYQLFSIRKIIDYKLLFRDLSKYLVASLIMFIVVSILNKLLLISWGMLMIEVIVGFISYIAIIVLMKVSLIEYVKKIIYSK
ncbi:polysaccharide biosynthesis C-terminal domain-containing protein [Companilactobacillus zhachilii]|uniref:oligosaccharide flippase family protein n=1 Tax=Companilactobacillus zhachilii TaxID=2304606 RepID=UPI001922B36B|nr:polysaccharide biosynthesis C-terminal domain-containing protein [Companilactobacillus zhachilii]MBL3532014.1 polysaccharide biosynthesis C-terminal domain-containing protein [Companilactobacillus zhachilii]